MGCFRGSLVQLASSGEILATGSTRYHLSFSKLLEWYQSQVNTNSNVIGDIDGSNSGVANPNWSLGRNLENLPKILTFWAV